MVCLQPPCAALWSPRDVLCNAVVSEMTGPQDPFMGVWGALRRDGKIASISQWLKIASISQCMRSWGLKSGMRTVHMLAVVIAKRQAGAQKRRRGSILWVRAGCVCHPPIGT